MTPAAHTPQAHLIGMLIRTSNPVPALSPPGQGAC